MKRELIVTALATAAILATTGFPAHAVTGNALPAVGTKLSSGDVSFVHEASSSGQAEVEFGQLLTQKAQSQALKDYGNRLIRDHTLANEKLARIALEKGVTVATEPNAKERKELDALQSLSATDFAETAKEDAIRDHREAIQMFQEASQTLQDPDLRQFAKQTLPVLEEHLRLAQQLKVGPAQGAQH
ncbi:MAG TPA: DUF4142 domain-containing protein [Verrucomicrobiae bacterium]|nr:DUF4142 domain-containing protein [Verrucomicrobiae bacterium]